MGALTGTISYSLFHVQGALEGSFRDEVLERLGRFAFEELRPDAEEDFTVGWCVAGDLLDTAFTREKVFWEPYACFSMRTDRWSLPGALMKALVRRREEERQAERQVSRLGRAERELIREEVSRGLKEQLLPSANAVDVVWNPDAGVVRFWSQSVGRVEVFQELFEATFEVRLVGSSAYVEAVECGLSPEEVGALATVEMATFGAIEEVR